MTQTRREYAASLGLAIAGARGKFSNEAKAAIAEAEAKGMVFSDSGPKVAPTPREPKTVSYKDAAETSKYLLPDEYRYPEAEYIATGTDGKRYSMRECCNTCRVSLVNHACATPTVHGSIGVTITRRLGVNA